MKEKDQIFERDLSILTDTLKIIARNECYNAYLRQEDRPLPCDCPSCLARRAINGERSWRYYGARAERMIYNPRERKIIDSWRAKLNDKLLCDILDENNCPSPRDWFVATSVVQWLATNVGSGILNEAGWTYQEYEKIEGSYKRGKRRSENFERERSHFIL